MYRLLTALLLILTTSTSSYAQVQSDTHPFKGANAIEISTTLADEELFKIIEKYLVAEEFDTESSNKDLGQIVTVPRDNGKLLSYYHQYKLSIVNHKVRIRANFGADKEKIDMENTYTKNSRFWPSLEGIVVGIKSILPHGLITYHKL